MVYQWLLHLTRRLWDRIIAVPLRLKQHCHCYPLWKRLKKQCEEGLATIRETITRLRHQENDSFTRIPVGEVNMDEFPWNRALAILDEFVSTRNSNSSVCNRII